MLKLAMNPEFELAVKKVAKECKDADVDVYSKVSKCLILPQSVDF